MSLSPVSVLFLITLARADLISRILHPKYDPDTSKEIALEERKLSNLLETELTNLSNAWQPLPLPERTFYIRRSTAELSGVQLTVGTASALCRPDLRQKVISLAHTAEDIVVQGHYSFQSSYSAAGGHFKSRVERVKCSGTAALGDAGMEWLLLDCPRRSPPQTQIAQLNGSGGLTNSLLELSDGVDSVVDSEVEEALRTLLAASLRSALSKSPSGVLAKNQAYLSMSQVQEMDSNTLLDAAIGLITFVVERRYNDSVPIPDIWEGFRINVLLLSLDTGFLARRGTARGVTGLSRLGNARIVFRNDTVHFAGALTIPRLFVEYGEYRAAVLGLGPVGRLDVTVAPVSVGLRLRVDFDQRKIFLDSFRITTLGKTDVAVSGVGRLTGRILTEITNSFHGLVRKVLAKVVEERVTAYTRASLKKNSLDQILTGEVEY